MLGGGGGYSVLSFRSCVPFWLIFWFLLVFGLIVPPKWVVYDGMDDGRLDGTMMTGVAAGRYDDGMYLTV